MSETETAYFEALSAASNYRSAVRDHGARSDEAVAAERRRRSAFRAYEAEAAVRGPDRARQATVVTGA